MAISHKDNKTHTKATELTQKIRKIHKNDFLTQKLKNAHKKYKLHTKLTKYNGTL